MLYWFVRRDFLILCCKYVSLIGLFARNQRIHRKIFCVYHPLKNAPVLSIYISVLYYWMKFESRSSVNK